MYKEHLSKKVPTTYEDFYFVFPKYPRFWNLKMDFFHLKTEVSTYLRNMFFSQNTPDFKTWSLIFVRQKNVFPDFWKYDIFLINYDKILTKIRETFLIGREVGRVVAHY